MLKYEAERMPMKRDLRVQKSKVREIVEGELIALGYHSIPELAFEMVYNDRWRLVCQCTLYSTPGVAEDLTLTWDDIGPWVIKCLREIYSFKDHNVELKPLGELANQDRRAPDFEVVVRDAQKKKN